MKKMSARTTAWVGALAAATLTVSACGSSSKGSSTTTAPKSDAPKLTGAPVKVMTITPEDTAQVNFPDIGTVAQTYAAYINAKGGIKGGPLQVTVCNDKNDPNTAAACARQAVSDKDVAVLGSFSTGAGSILPVLEAAKIPYLAANAITATEYTSKESFPIVAGPIGLLANGVEAAKHCAKTDLIVYDTPSAAGLTPFIAAGLGTGGKSVNKTVKVPTTTTDFSSTVSAAKGADCIISVLPEQTLVQYLAKAKALGVTQKVFAPAGGIASAALKSAGSQLDGSETVSSYPIASDPAWDTFKSALKSAGKTVDLNSPEALNAWVAFVVFDKVAADLPTIDGPSVTAALDKSSAIDTGGLTPLLNFTKPFPVPQLARLFNTQLIVVDIKGGQFVQDGTFTDYASKLLPKK